MTYNNIENTYIRGVVHIMQKSKRIQLIYAYIKEHKDVQINDLSSHIEASQSTIRRDIKDLASKGLVTELYGSVILNDKNDTDILIKQRKSMQSNEKQAIGKKAAKLILNDSFVYIDAGTTTKTMIQNIKATGCKFVTNGMDIALSLMHEGFDAYIVGGQIKPITEAVVGEFALDYLRLLHFDIAFIGANGVSSLGYSTPDEKEGLIKRQAIKQSRKSYILADTTKMNKTTSFIFAKEDDAFWINESENIE